MGDDAPLVAPGSIHMREIFDVKEKDQFKFREYAWSMGDDVNATLEDNAVEVTCKAMGWEVPTNWREVRTKQCPTCRYTSSHLGFGYGFSKSTHPSMWTLQTEKGTTIDMHGM